MFWKKAKRARGLVKPDAMSGDCYVYYADEHKAPADEEGDDYDVRIICVTGQQAVYAKAYLKVKGAWQEITNEAVSDGPPNSTQDADEGSLYCDRDAPSARSSWYQKINGRWMRPPLETLEMLVRLCDKNELRKEGGTLPETAQRFFKGYSGSLLWGRGRPQDP